MALTIKRNGVALPVTVNPIAGGYLQRQRNGINFVKLDFTQTVINPVALLLDDTVEVMGTTYHLVDKLPEVTKLADKRHLFSCIFEAEWYKFKRLRYYSIDPTNQLKEKDFSINGDLLTFANLLILNLNREWPGVWSLGVVDVTEVRLVNFSNANCLEAISQLVQEFQTEVWYNNHTINFQVKTKNSGLTFAYGQGNGLYEIKRTNDSENAPITRLTVFGGSRNLPDGYRNYSQKLQLNAPLELPPSPTNPPTNEDNVEFPDVFPQFTGTVSATTDEFTFECIDIPFNPNATGIAIPGTKAKVIFQTGQLAGYEMEVSSYDDTTKTFVLDTLKTEQSLVVPQPGIEAAVGDLFIVVDITMPSTFVTNAETLLLQFGLDYFNKVNYYKSKYDVIPDPLDFKRKGRVLVEGELAMLTDSSLGVNRLIPIESFQHDYIKDEVKSLVLSDYADIDFATKLLRKAIAQANAIKQPGAIQQPRAYSYERAEAFIRNNCGSGYDGTQVTFRKKYTSSVSKADAQSMAFADANYPVEGQTFANGSGTCVLAKPISIVSISNVSYSAHNGLVDITAANAPDTNILVDVEIYGDVSGITKVATVTLNAGSATASGSTVGASFIPSDGLTGTIVGITPSEDSTYRFRA
ncbi:MAG: hypothetical protein EOO42_01220 [Flavobacteriales bacterium]|nr:MAG: hypothetical protein EOO42_01220 [Flavobacteriales bacterium]